MIRWSMNTRFKVGSTISVAMVVLIGILALYHLHVLNIEINASLNLDSDAVEAAHVQKLAENHIRIAEIARGFQTRLGIVALLATAIALYLAIFFSVQISLPIRRLQDIIHAVRDGNYTVPVKARGKDEIGVLVAALAHMIEHVRARDTKKMHKIDLEKRRYAALANVLGAPILLINHDHCIAFANDEFLGNFRLAWNDIYEVPLSLASIPKELKERIETCLKTHEFPQAEPLDIIGESYAFDLTLTFLPVYDQADQMDSLLCILGPIPPKTSAELKRNKVRF